jgi:protocatechuate 3,4-dioxygenase beta subunit
MSIPRRALTRRQTLTALGAAGAGAVLAGAGAAPGALGGLGAEEALAASCTLTPEQEVGPFYVALERIRSTIVGTRKGVPLDLRITIVDAATCKPITGAAVDIWHADAAGVYSDESSQDTVGQTWLRGVQLTDARGLAKFTTIYPGFYEGRATHIHVKVHIGGSHASTRFSGGHVSHNGQLFVPDALSSKVYKLAPYTSDENTRTLHAADRVWTQQHGASSVLTIVSLGDSLKADGLRGKATLGVDTSATT